ncbi:MAG: hypothetical protein HYZ75_00790 [Elusimicrobia bacterium]|nr:hypothetical protein [Elusimicrobiota bacterium]
MSYRSQAFTDRALKWRDDLTDIEKTLDVAGGTSPSQDVLNNADTGKKYLRNGWTPYLVAVGNDMDSGGSGSITFRFLVNGQPVGGRLGFLQSFKNSLGRISEPYQLSEPIELPPGALVELYADNADASNTHQTVGRLIVEYY